MNVQCPNCKQTNTKFVDKYKFHVSYDETFLKKMDIFNCKACDLSFAEPMPSDDDLNKYYSFVYRAKYRPHNIDHKTPKGILLSRLGLLTQYVNFSKVKNVLDVGAGSGEIGQLLKENFDLNIFSIEPDEYARDVLAAKGYLNFDQKKQTELKFDLVVSTQSLEHFNSIDNFFKIFEYHLNEKAIVFVEVPHNSLESWFNDRPYDSPHCLFFSKKGLENIFLKRNYKIIFSDYIGEDINKIFKLMSETKKDFYNWKPNKIGLKKFVKEIIKKFIPTFILKLKNNIMNFSSDTNYKDNKYGDKNSWWLRILVKK